MGLGFFRLVLSLWVIDHHYFISKERIEPFVVSALGEKNLGFLGIGHIAVISFFVLSGYVITWVLKNKYPHNEVGIKAFFLGRFIRIYPLYWGILILFITLAFLFSGLKHGQELVPSLSAWRIFGDLLLLPYGFAGFFLESNHYAYGMIDLPAWTLPYDLVFYLVAPWLVMRKSILWAVISFELLYLVFLGTLAPLEHWHGWYLTTGHAQLLAFSVGAAAWYFRETRVPGWMLIGAVFFMLYLVFVPYKLTNLYFNHLLVLLFTVVIVLGAKNRSPIDNFFGELTYSTYLLHVPVLSLLIFLGLDHPGIIGIVCTYVLSLFVVKYIESPLDRLRSRITTVILKEADAMPVKNGIAGNYISIAVITFLVISAGYNLSFVRSEVSSQVQADALKNTTTTVLNECNDCQS